MSRGKSVSARSVDSQIVVMREIKRGAALRGRDVKLEAVDWGVVEERERGGEQEQGEGGLCSEASTNGRHGLGGAFSSRNDGAGALSNSCDWSEISTFRHTSHVT
jgi:hypothetical protein